MNKFLRIALILILCNSCSKDDSENTKGIEGTYELTAVIVPKPYDGNNDGVFSDNLKDELSCLSGILEINGNTWATSEYTGWESRMEGEDIIWSCFGNPSSNSGEIFDITENSFRITFETYKLSGNTLTVENYVPIEIGTDRRWIKAVFMRK